MVSTLSAHPAKNDRTTRTLGSIGVLGSPLLALMGLLSVPNSTAPAAAGVLISLAFLLSWMCVLIGMRRQRATGNSKEARWLLLVQMMTLSLAACQSLQDALQMDAKTTGLFYTICDLSWPTSMLSMLIVFGFLWKANVWHGWRRWPALAWGLSFPCFFAAIPFLGREKAGLFFVAPVTLSFLLLSLAVCTNSGPKEIKKAI